MQNKIEQLRDVVRVASADPSFVHHKWFVKWHLKIVQKIAQELCEYYPEADRDIVETMVWLHDYGKILDFNDQYAKTLIAGKEILHQLDFPFTVADKIISYIETLDKKLELDLSQAPIEVKIVSSADGCSHMIGPFLPIFWNEATDKTFAGKEFEDLMSLNLAKTEKDWNHKIVLPEARKHLRAVISYYENKRASFLQVLSNSSAVPPCQTGTKITELEKRKSSWK